MLRDRNIAAVTSGKNREHILSGLKKNENIFFFRFALVFKLYLRINARKGKFVILFSHSNRTKIRSYFFFFFYFIFSLPQWLYIFLSICRRKRIKHRPKSFWLYQTSWFEVLSISIFLNETIPNSSTVASWLLHRFR